MVYLYYYHIDALLISIMPIANIAHINNIQSGMSLKSPNMCNDHEQIVVRSIDKCKEKCVGRRRRRTFGWEENEGAR